MSQISLKKMIWQSELKENPITGITVKEGLKPEDKKSKEPSLKYPPMLEVILKQLLENAPYPDFRYFCPLCGSLDVCITSHKKSEKITVDCLDCKKVWIEGVLQKGAAT